MERRAQGDERPIPLPWSNVSAALGGGFWGGTLVTLVGDTGSGKTQWALQAGPSTRRSPASPSATWPRTPASTRSRPDCWPSRRGSGGRTSTSAAPTAETLKTRAGELCLRAEGLPFHMVGTRPAPNQPPDIRSITTWVRERYPEEHPGTRPFLVVLDFVQMVSGAGQDRDDLRR